MELEGKDILQIDTTIITGVLILLTLSLSTSETVSNIPDKRVLTLEIIKSVITLSIIFPFAMSATHVMLDYISKKQPGYWPVRFMTIGFIYIMVGIVLIVVIQLVR